MSPPPPKNGAWVKFRSDRPGLDDAHRARDGKIVAIHFRGMLRLVHDDRCDFRSVGLADARDLEPVYEVRDLPAVVRDTLPAGFRFRLPERPPAPKAPRRREPMAVTVKCTGYSRNGGIYAFQFGDHGGVEYSSLDDLRSVVAAIDDEQAAVADAKLRILAKALASDADLSDSNSVLDLCCRVDSTQNAAVELGFNLI